MTPAILPSLNSDILRLVESLHRDVALNLSREQTALVENRLLATQQEMVLQFSGRGPQLPAIAAECLRDTLGSALTDLADGLFQHQKEPFNTSQLDRIHREFQRLYDRFDESLETHVAESNAIPAKASIWVNTVPLPEILGTLDECVRLLADHDERDGDERTIYRRCLALRQRLSLAATP